MTHDTLDSRAHPLDDAAIAALAERLAGSRYVLLGEATHGTHEFYDLRADLTRRLIADHGFHAVALEADWPDAARLDGYVRHRSDDADPRAALGDFTRFPTWMWRNTVVAGFAAWLREHNADRDVPTGIYGMDLYSLFTSIEEVLRYLDAVDPEAAERARLRYDCFDHVGVDGQRYGHAIAVAGQEPCEADVVEQLVELRRNAHAYVGSDGQPREDAFFDAEQNARLVADAERYYRAMFRGRDDSWNLRDTHMADTVDALAEHHASRVGEPRIAVWAHNSHLGDARATEMGRRRGQINVGQLLRERHPGQVTAVGFTTHRGHVTAASQWDGPMLRQRVRDALPDSHEAVLHEVAADRFWLDMHDPDVAATFGEPRLERAIGVVYRPETERISHYFSAQLPSQFDVVIHIDETTALQPLDPTSAWESGKVPDTYPWAV
ncbi:MAG: erythromycin esterase family protein [Actinomycetota bacterium]|nr:erythromycin esterase family protein [Actinomycetota bacterium]